MDAEAWRVEERGDTLTGRWEYGCEAQKNRATWNDQDKDVAMHKVRSDFWFGQGDRVRILGSTVRLIVSLILAFLMKLVVS